MQAVLGAPLPVFIGLTVVLFGAAAAMTGQALALTWRPAWQAVPYCLLLGLGNRFLAFALFGAELFAPLGYAVGTAVLVIVCLFAYRVTRASRMVSQYPWLYERAGLFGWREIS
jgi:hypothetical protein